MTLVDTCLAHAPNEGHNATAVPCLALFRRSATAPPASAVYRRGIFLVVQGRKQARVGDEIFTYDPEHYLVTAVPMPVHSQIRAASDAEPFLSLSVAFDFEAVRELTAVAGDVLPPRAAAPPQRGLAACPVTPPIATIVERFLDLLSHPADIPVVAPLLQRELLYHVLKGPRGGLLRAVAMGHGQQHAIAEVLTTIHADCARPCNVTELAAMAAMSESAFYEAFKAVTATTPVQYIKRLRLQEAHRRLSLGLNNVSTVAYEVGYNNLSQFSREFTRLFGANPSAYLQ